MSESSIQKSCGIAVPQIVNLSILAGAVLSWGILWPVINTKAGQWYPVSTDEHNVKGLFGYQIFLQLGMALGDTLYRIIKLAVSMASAIVRWYRARHRLPQTAQDADPGRLFCLVRQRHSELHTALAYESLNCLQATCVHWAYLA